MMATDTTDVGIPPHPYIQSPLLYITNLQPYVKDTDLARAFENCVPFRPTIQRNEVDDPTPVNGIIEFKHVEKAELALATLQGRQIPDVSPVATLNLSPYPPTNPPPPLPHPAAVPRIVKHLPPGYTEVKTYYLFRPFGAISNVQTNTVFGKDTAIVEFYLEDDAKRAELELHCVEVEGSSLAVQPYHPRRTNTGVESGFNAKAAPFVPSGTAAHWAQSQYSPPRQYSYSAVPARVSPTPFIHGPGQQVQFAPLHGPGSTSHSGLIDPCNLFCKNLDPSIDSNALFANFRIFGTIVSARVMRDEHGRSRGFGFVSFQTPDQATTAMNTMNGIVLGNKQIIVRLHEPKQLRQEKLAHRFGSNNGSTHPRSRSGATSPTASEGGESYGGWAAGSTTGGYASPYGGSQGFVAGGSPRFGGSPMGFGNLNLSPRTYHSSLTGTTLVGTQTPNERGRRGSGSYYHAALAGHLNIPLTMEDLSALSNVVRHEVLMGELHRRLRAQYTPADGIDGTVDALLALPLDELVRGLNDDISFNRMVRTIRGENGGDDCTLVDATLSLSLNHGGIMEQSRQSASPSPASLSSSHLLDATASAPEHPSTPVSMSASLSTPPRTSSPSGSHSFPLTSHSHATTHVHATATPAVVASDRDRFLQAVGKLEKDEEKVELITDLLMSLSKKERAMCLFSVEVLKGKVNDARLVLESAEDSPVEPPRTQPLMTMSITPPPRPASAPLVSEKEKMDEPSTPVLRRAAVVGLDTTPHTPNLSFTSTTTASGGGPLTPPTQSSPAHTISSLAKLPATKIIEIVRSPSSTGLPLPKADPLVVKSTNEFIDSLQKETVLRQKQQLGDKLFKVVKGFGIKGAPKVTIALLDQSDDLRALAHLMNSYPTVLKEKAVLAQAALLK